MKKRWGRALELGGIAGLLLLSLNLVIPMMLAYINGSQQIVYRIDDWEMTFEPFLFVGLWLWGLYVLISRWRAK